METGVINAMCRCCASEGAFKDFKSAYHWMGEEEVYADMLRECFDITLSTSEDGFDGGICEVCITQLRNASNFKKQVLLAEDQFKKHVQNKLFKPNIVKVEMSPDEDSDGLSGDDTFSTEFEVPIKEEETLEEPKGKKRGAKATTSKGAKKSKNEAGESSTKRIDRKSQIKIVPVKVSNAAMLLTQTISAATTAISNVRTINTSGQNKIKIIGSISSTKKTPTTNTELKEIDKHLINIRTILLYSNATPIRSHNGIKYACCFCAEGYILPKDLKTHAIEDHSIAEKKLFMQDIIISEYCVKLDVTDLKCRICNQNIDSVEKLMEHLKEDHIKTIHTDIKSHILPFKFDSEELKCAVCSTAFANFKKMLEHMRQHYTNYFCGVCSAPFVTKRHLWGHLARHEQGQFTCSYCPKTFNARAKLLYHENSVHVVKHMRNVCPHCSKRFVTYEQRNDHMVQVHGDEPMILKCKACDKTFNKKCNLTKHMRRDHLLERSYECRLCEQKFFQKMALKCHLLKHTGERQHTCNVCGNSYKRKYTLKQHMKIHENN